MSSDESHLKDIKGNLIKLRDQLKETAQFYDTLCSQLRGVESLSSSVSMDYYDIKNTNDQTFKRLNKWRALERKIFYTIEHHTSNRFQRSSLYENKFMKTLNKTKFSPNLDRDSEVIKNCNRVKEGLVAIKYSSEARRRVMDLSGFLASVKSETKRDGYDYWENMMIMNGLCSWVREIIYDSSRATSLGGEKEFSTDSSGQSVYANDMIKKVINFAKSNTKKRLEPSDNVVARKMVDMTLNRKDLSLIDENMTRLHNSKNYVNSQITYYLFNLLDDLRKGNTDCQDLEKLKKLEFDFSLKIEHPLHVYDIQEYYSNFRESSTILVNIHRIEQFFLKNTSLSYSEIISGKIIPIMNNEKFIELLNKVQEKSEGTPSMRLVQSVLSAFRTAYFMFNQESKDLLKIWDKSPYPELCEA